MKAKFVRFLLFLFIPSILHAQSLGLRPSDVPHIKAEPPIGDPPYESYWNWADEGFVTDVKDQAQCGASVSFSVAGVMESLIRIKNNEPTLDIDLSEQDIVACGPRGNGWGGCDGNDFDRVCDYVQYYGIVDEDCFPYIGWEIDCNNRCDAGINYKISNYDFLPYTYIHNVYFEDINWNLHWGTFYIPSVNTIKDALQESPIVAGMAIFNDLNYHNPSNIDDYFDPFDFTYEGLHSVIIVGWDDSDSTWICKNSWGSDWGTDGYFKIQWIDYNLDLPFGYITNSPVIGFDAVQLFMNYYETTTTSSLPTTSSSILTTTSSIPISTSSIFTTSITTSSILTTTSSILTTTSSVLPPPPTTTTTTIDNLYIAGSVVGRAGIYVQGLTGVKVVLNSPTRSTFKITDQSGEFRFVDLDYEPYEVIIEDSRGFKPKSYQQDLYEAIDDLRFTLTEESCLIVSLFGEYSEEVEMLRFIRDNVLSKTPEGQEIIKQYYQWSPVVAIMMEEDEEFKEDVKKMVDGVLELIGGVE